MKITIILVCIFSLSMLSLTNCKVDKLIKKQYNQPPQMGQPGFPGVQSPPQNPYALGSPSSQTMPGAHGQGVPPQPQQGQSTDQSAQQYHHTGDAVASPPPSAPPKPEAPTAPACQSNAKFDVNQTIELAKDIAEAVFDQGTTPEKEGAKKAAIAECFAHLTNNSQAKDQIKNFFDECKKISVNALQYWRNDIMESTILSALSGYKLSSNKAVTCDQAVLPFAEPNGTKKWKELNTIFSRVFPPCGTVTPSGARKKFLVGVVATRRELLPGSFFAKLNIESGNLK